MARDSRARSRPHAPEQGYGQQAGDAALCISGDCRPVVFNIEQLRQACTTSNQLAWRRLIQLKEFCSETAHQIATQVRAVDDPCAQVKVIRDATMEALLTFVGKFRPRCSFVLGESGLR